MNSGQFDANWYVRRYPDVLLSGMDPAEHYLWLGKRLGRRPKPAKPEDEVLDFSTIQPLSWQNSKAHQNEYAPAHDTLVETLAAWSGLDKAFVCYQLGVPVEHNATRVAEIYYEGRKRKNIFPNPLFDPEYYKETNRLGYKEDPVYHFLTKGMGEHLNTHRLFDHEWYYGKYPSSIDAKDLILHYWENGYKENIIPVNPESVKILDPIKDVFFSDSSDKSESSYDSLSYWIFNPDLHHLHEEGLKAHYKEIGYKEGRIASIYAVLRKLNFSGKWLPIDFDPEQYISLHVDLEQSFSDSPWHALSHFIKSGMVEGRLYQYAQLNGANNSVQYELDEEKLKTNHDRTPLCVLVHLYYPEMWGELASYLKNIDFDFDLRVNFVESTWTAAAIDQVRQDFPEAIIKISPNEGRDIGGFFSLLRDVDFSKYMAFSLMHSKKSPHVTRDYASLWKQNLLNAILGSRDIVRENIAAFLENDAIGIIGSIRSRHAGIEGNEQGMTKLFDLYNIEEEYQDCEYVSGTMMMVRSDVMEAVYQPLSNHKFTNGDGKDISHHIDGQVEHSVERIFGNVMKQLGYRFLWR